MGWERSDLPDGARFARVWGVKEGRYWPTERQWKVVWERSDQQKEPHGSHWGRGLPTDSQQLDILESYPPGLAAPIRKTI